RRGGRCRAEPGGVSRPSAMNHCHGADRACVATPAAMSLSTILQPGRDGGDAEVSERPGATSRPGPLSLCEPWRVRRRAVIAHVLAPENLRDVVVADLPRLPRSLYDHGQVDRDRSVGPVEYHPRVRRRDAIRQGPYGQQLVARRQPGWLLVVVGL